jgi:ABC-type branched-subunit amino acid transport system ATPase component/ABC-type branched-subunit amino acid transport system permease subunit
MSPAITLRGTAGWRAGGILAIIALIVVAPVVASWTSDAYYYVSVLSFTCVSIILTLSLNVATGFGGMLTLMQTGIQLLGGYTVALCLVRLGIPWLVGIFVAGVVCSLVSLGVVLLSLRSSYLYFGMLTLVVNLVLIEVGQSWISVTGGNVGLYDIGPTWGGAAISPQVFFYVIAAFAVAAYIVQRNYVLSTFGRATMAIRESPATASGMGIDPTKMKLLSLGVSGALGGVAGALYALQLGAINPSVGQLESGLIFFVGLFIGGVGTIAGPVFGTILIAIVSSFSRFYPAYTNLIMGAALLLVLAVMPEGIAGTVGSRLERRRRGLKAEDGTGSSSPDKDVLDLAPAGVAPRAGEVVLEAVEVRKHFGGVRALDGVTIQIRTGAVHGIIGPNGSGKSTLVDCLTRFQPLTAGEVLLYGHAAPRRAYQIAVQGVTRVFQIPRIFGRVSVRDNVLTGMHVRTAYSFVGAIVRSRGFRRWDRRQRDEAGRLLQFARLAGVGGFSGDSLSHGQKRLLEVVRAVATNPRVLILDEPATGLTGIELDELARLCRLLKDRGIAVVLIEHNVGFVMDLCDVITVLDGGRVIAEGVPEEIRASEVVRAAYLGGHERKGSRNVKR